MTRDEAIAAFHNSTPNPASFADSAWIDRFVALGMLKLDEPKTVGQRIEDIVNRHVSERQRQCVLGAMRNEGLL